MTIVLSKKLNYGIIEYDDSGYFILKYNAPGIGVDLSGLTNIDAINYAEKIKDIANENINYLNKYQNYIRQGGCVGECVNSKFFAQDTCEKVKEGCELFQGGFKHFWTIEQIEELKKPDYDMISDSEDIENFVDTVCSSYKCISPPPSVTYILKNKLESDKTQIKEGESISFTDIVSVRGGKKEYRTIILKIYINNKFFKQINYGAETPNDVEISFNITFNEKGEYTVYTLASIWGHKREVKSNIIKIYVSTTPPPPTTPPSTPPKKPKPPSIAPLLLIGGLFVFPFLVTYLLKPRK